MVHPDCASSPNLSPKDGYYVILDAPLSDDPLASQQDKGRASLTCIVAEVSGVETSTRLVLSPAMWLQRDATKVPGIPSVQLLAICVHMLRTFF
jgi:hypothetical protein